MASVSRDERIADVGWVRRLLLRPAFGAVVGAILVFAFFAWQSEVFRSLAGVSNWLDPASTLGIMAVAIALLMIGGEFDLSAGVLTGTSGLVMALLCTKAGLNVWAAMAVALVVALAIGFVNGYLVIKTKLPSFIITLGTFLTLQGINLGATKALAKTVQVSGVDKAPGYDTARMVFAGTFEIAGARFRVAILWWLAATAIASWLLARTRTGNWIFSVGGNVHVARNVGVPAAQTKIGLFMGTALCAWLVGMITTLRLTSVQTNMGIGQEFIYIIAAVIGGCLLSGGYGSAIGAAIGAVIFGMVEKGIIYAGWDSDWYKLFLGVMLVLATLANQMVRRYAENHTR